MSNNSATRVLRDEHQLILQVLDVLESILDTGSHCGTYEWDAIERCTEFFRLFADACHHGKEEDLLFPVLESRGIPRDGGPIGVMLYEHEQGRALVREMREYLAAARTDQTAAVARVVDAGRNFIALLRNHIAKEDQILFMMADRVVDATACQELCGSYAHVCARQFDGRTKEQLEQLATELVSGQADAGRE